MHLLESYALQSAQKVDKIDVLSEFYYIPFEKYITFQPFSKPSKNFDYFVEVLEILKPYLEKENIKVVQIGAKDEKPFPFCYYTQGTTSIRQVDFIIKHSLLHLSADTFSVALASRYDIPIVALYSNNYLNCVKPYFGTPEKQILLEPNRKELLPSFSFEENPKTINLIKSEKIAAAVCKLLNLPFSYPYKSVSMGLTYQNTIIEQVPNILVNPASLNLQFINVRMDLLFNEEKLAEQLKICPCSILTNRPISEKILKAYRPHVKELFYELDDKHDPNFVKLLHKLAIPYGLFTYFTEEHWNKFKLDYMDFNLVNYKKTERPAFLEKKDIKNLYFKSNKFTLSNGKIYSSKADWFADRPIKNFQDNLQPITDSNDFWKELEYFYILEKCGDNC